MRTHKLLSIVMIFVIFGMIFSGCNNTKNQGTEAIVIIDGEKIDEAEIMLYLLQVKAQFEEVAGVEIWETEDFSAGKTAEQVAKDGALVNLFKSKILVNKASSMGITMEDSVNVQTTEIAKQYFAGISPDVVADHGITEQGVIDSFLDFRIASEVEAAIENKYEPSEEEITQKMLENQDYATYKDYKTEEILTLAEVKQIFTRTGNMDENNELVLLSEDEQKAAYDKIKQAHELAIKGDNFDTLVATYSDNSSMEKEQISIVDLKKFFTEIAIGQISDIAQTSNGYYVFKIINIIEPDDEAVADYQSKFKEWEDTLRQESIDKLKKDAFEEIYSEWEKETPTEVNNDLWDKISIF